METYPLKLKTLRVYVKNIVVFVHPFLEKETILKILNFIQRLKDEKFTIYKTECENCSGDI